MRISCNARDSGSEYRLLHLQIKVERLKYIKDIKLFNLVVKIFCRFFDDFKNMCFQGERQGRRQRQRQIPRGLQLGSRQTQVNKDKYLLA